MIGTILNVAAVVLGGSAGTMLGQRLPDRVRQTVMQGLGLVTLVVGLQMTADTANILIVMTDHQRADTALPEHPALTPNLDRFAAEGVTFTNAFCPSPHCCPSRATFFTGLYPTRHGVWNNICNDQALRRGLKPGVAWPDCSAEPRLGRAATAGCSRRPR